MDNQQTDISLNSFQYHQWNQQIEMASEKPRLSASRLTSRENAGRIVNTRKEIKGFISLFKQYQKEMILNKEHVEQLKIEDQLLMSKMSKMRQTIRQSPELMEQDETKKRPIRQIYYDLSISNREILDSVDKIQDVLVKITSFTHKVKVLSQTVHQRSYIADLQDQFDEKNEFQKQQIKQLQIISLKEKDSERLEIKSYQQSGQMIQQGRKRLGSFYQRQNKTHQDQRMQQPKIQQSQPIVKQIQAYQKIKKSLVNKMYIFLFATGKVAFIHSANFPNKFKSFKSQSVIDLFRLYQKKRQILWAFLKNEQQKGFRWKDHKRRSKEYYQIQNCLSIQCMNDGQEIISFLNLNSRFLLQEIKREKKQHSQPTKYLKYLMLIEYQRRDIKKQKKTISSVLQDFIQNEIIFTMGNMLEIKIKE